MVLKMTKYIILSQKYRFKAPEDTWNYVYDRLIVSFIPPETEIDYKVLSIWTTKNVEELKENKDE